jgi:hypothetical protein
MKQGNGQEGMGEDALEAGVGAAAEAAGGLVGLAAASKLGPAGGVIIAAATAETLRHLATQAIGLRDYQASRALEIAAHQANVELDELRRRLTADPRRLQLTAAALSAAAATALDAKIRVLGRALATGAIATDDATVDEQQLLVAAMADLEAPHVRVLNQLSIQHAGYWGPKTLTGQAHGWSPHDLATQVPGIAAVLQPILTVLAGHGLIMDTGVGTWGYSAGESQRWVLTDYGKRCLAELEALGNDPSHG